MGMRIFDTDPDAKRERTPASYADEFDGKLSGGKMENGNPVSLSEWRFVLPKQETADALEQLYGGRSTELETDNDYFIELLTNAKQLSVILDGPKAVQSDLKLFNQAKKLAHHCDGVVFLSDEPVGAMRSAGEDCGCPTSLSERKALARDFMGPKPSISVTFSLADDPELGTFRYQTGSWTLAEILWEAEEDLSDIGGEALATLTLEPVEFVAKGGPMKGKTVSYTKPVLRVIKSLNSAVAD